MSIYKAMWAGVSGLAAESQALGVVGDNVANSNTIGFKMSRAMFEDVLGGAAGMNVGGGVRMVRAQQLFGQGSLMNTGQGTDLALTGDGFFVVKGALDGVAGQFYSRAGQFTLDKDGNMVNPQGMHLQGYAANGDGTFAGGLSDVNVPNTPLAPKPTSEFKVQVALDSREALPTVTPFDPLNTKDSSNFSSSTTVYDSLGNAHTMDTYYVNLGGGNWEYHTVVDGGELTGGTAGTPTEIGSGTMTFDTSGNLTSTSATTPISANFLNAAPNQAITLDFTDSTQTAQVETNINQSQDGYASGLLTGVQVDGNGTVLGVYSNGEKVEVAKLAVAKFASNDGLGRGGHNLWMATRASGEPAIGESGAGGRAAIVAGALEQSNVDIAQQFVEMISHQRAFQANSKTITTADEMLQELVNLKR